MLPRHPGDAPRDLSVPLQRLRILVDGVFDGVRLDVMLSQVLHWRSRTGVHRLIEEGRVHLEGRRAVPSRKVRGGETIVIDVPPQPVPQAHDPGGGIDLAILHEDRWMVAVDKPAGMAVHPTGRLLSGTLIHALHKRYRRPAEPEHDVVPRLLHRIDAETSGVVAIGLDEQFHMVVRQQFEDRKVRKVYLAVVHGRPAPEVGSIDLPIGPDRASPVRLKMAALTDGSGLPARTDYRVLRHNGRFALVELRPHTGRQHQKIGRAHV